MHAEPTHCPRPASMIEIERTVMMVLLSGEHEPWTRADLQREVAGTKDDPLAAIDALNHSAARSITNKLQRDFGAINQRNNCHICRGRLEPVTVFP
jgi:hypothetical protein